MDDAPNQIRALRERLAQLVPSEYTQAAFSRRLGVTSETLRAWETGKHRPHQRAAKRLAKMLGVTVEELGLEEPPAES
jgi:DNA-binding transcriptional regulator YiaG